MTEQPTDHARSFGSVADAYARARPSYPTEAVSWLVGSGRRRVLELGAGTGKLTRLLVDAGHEVLATDPSPQMLAHLHEEVPEAITVAGAAEHIPAPSRSVDLVVCAQSFHWFDPGAALPEISRVLRPGGFLALVWNQRDERIPWVKKLGRIIGTEGQDQDLVKPVRDSLHFGFVEDREFRFWQQLNPDNLLDLVRSRSYVAVLPEEEREVVLGKVRDLYEDYGRGHDGMLLPYVTRCYRAVVRDQAPVTDPPRRAPGEDEDEADDVPPPTEPPDDPGTLLIDFH